ncbi:YicC/YloC family endoribonuclease [Effusibacillus pohliae]|uniref:YicC/YloC family endoribonuclease n=1 Tax=Effusibacillus pohliae TaxID=232270 RepID=UPI0003A2EE10|nr:YicC/YloC family endoribonuclease [Effusibacillus pohliae]
MIRSMTGYGRGEAVQEGYRAVAELKAVNHRYAEINLRMPRDLLAHEDSIKRLILKKIRRGRVEVYITFERLSGGEPEIEINRPLAREIKRAGDHLADELGVRSDLSVAQLLQFEGVMQVKEAEADPEQVARVLSQAVAEAAEKLWQMRSREGERLAADFVERLDRLAELVERIAERSPLVVEEYRERVHKRVQEWLAGMAEPDESRLLTEIALFAERANIEEELVRLRSHIQQFRSALRLAEPLGRKLDFLLQEMNREVNTIGSKANDLAISRHVVEAKSVLEQIREQVQNVE